MKSNHSVSSKRKFILDKANVRVIMLTLGQLREN